jgi:AraC-like DNA-binding protein
MIPVQQRTNTADPLYNYMQNVSKKLECPITNHIIEVPADQGKGFVKSFFVEEGFCIGYYHFCFKEDVHFNWNADAKANDQQIFQLIFRLKTSEFIHPEDDGSCTRNFATQDSTVLYSSDCERSGIIPQDRWYNAIAMLFTRDWLQQNFTEASNSIHEIVSLLIRKNKPTFIAEIMQPHHYDMVRGLSMEMTQKQYAPIHIKTKSLLLVNDFLDIIVNRKKSDINSNQTLYQAEMVKVECKLSNYFDKPFPNLSQLAKDFNMSPATLQRHFKIVYGKSIHQYYLEKKLALGKELIAEKKKSISEIAYMLGYNKINSFSKVFKKYYGKLPKEMN